MVIVCYHTMVKYDNRGKPYDIVVIPNHDFI